MSMRPRFMAMASAAVVALVGTSSSAWACHGRGACSQCAPGWGAQEAGYPAPGCAPAPVQMVPQYQTSYQTVHETVYENQPYVEYQTRLRTEYRPENVTVCRAVPE